MAKVLGTISMTPKAGYPTLKGGDGDETLSMQYTCVEDELVSVPQYGDNFTDDRYPYFCTLTSHILDKRNIIRDKSGSVYHLELEYRDPSGNSSSPSGPIKEEWDYDTQDYDVPVEQAANYLTNWNHRLIAISGEASAPGWWATAIKTKLSDEDAKKFAWIKPGDKVPEGWFELYEEKKPGVESFRAGITTVNRVWRCSDLKKLTADVNKDYTINTPAKTFERSGEWLRGGSKIKKEGRMWVLTVSYLNIEEIDRDIYQ